MSTILVIDDNTAVAQALDLLFGLEGWQTRHADSPEAGLAVLETGSIDLVVQDMNFTADTTSGEEGIALFRAIRDRHPDLPVILMTAWTQLQSAIELVKAGACDYLAKPWDDRKLVATVANLLELGQANRQLQQTSGRERRERESLASRFDLCGFIFDDPATTRVLALATQVARSDLPILVTGPNGSGKEKIADIIRANSNVRLGPFITVNCGALPSDLIEAELFGAEAGAYTGANKAREGKFEAADGGTLFLDEIGNLPLPGQMKLLRVLETGRFSRLGSNREKQVTVRVISATNADLTAMIRAGTFREDLFYRLNVLEIRLPPLAERPRDIVPLARSFLGPEKILTEAACHALKAHAWPGNVRELKNVCARAALLTIGNCVDALDLGLRDLVHRAGGDEPEPDRDTIESALRRAHGVIAQAAQELGLSRQALYRRMERFGIPRGK